MRKVIDDPRLMVRVCDLYYNQGISQQQIAKDLNLSRPRCRGYWHLPENKAL